MYQLFAQKYWKERAVPFHFEFRNNQAPFPIHCHDFHELVYIYSGTAIHLTNYGNYEIKGGDILSIKPGQCHGFKKINNLVLMNILIQPSFLTQNNLHLNSIPAYNLLFEQCMKKKAEKNPPVHFTLSNAQSFEVRALIESMQQEIRGQYSGYITQAITFFLQLVVLLVRIYENKDYSICLSDNPSVRLIDYIETHFHKNIETSNLVEISGMSPSSVLRTCKRITGYSPSVYQKRLRMFSAINELVQSNKSITQIALDIGYNDSNYFSRLFKDFINLTPSEYRSQFREK
ncbi:helix-turn-helix domain-containing protein [Treponema sp. OMZ 840]|uniref:helix-turn-helix domain-containing protein n=1 Tax=Treponema sp. OMZ 840 TaxID=244313 RepID=UPI003D8FAF9B